MLGIASEESRAARPAGWRRRARRRWLPADLLRTWLYTYAVVWATTLTSAAVVGLAGPPLAEPTQRLLRLALTARHNPPPQLGHVILLAAHNIPIASWPLLLGVLGAHHHRVGTHVADGLLLACIIVNTLPVGAALGAYGTAVLPYAPQLPLEWGGLALGASGWLAQRRTALTGREGLGLFVVTVGVLVCAAVVETVGVLHR
jgi:hypothetical protein